MAKQSLTKRLVPSPSSLSARASVKKKPASCKLLVEALEDRVVPTAGPVALPANYALQPGFTPITDISQITGPGNYQLTADSNGGSITWDNVTLDGGGHSIGGSNPYQGLYIYGQGDVVKNSNISVYTLLNGANEVLSNNWISSTAVYNLDIYASGCTLSNNLIVGNGNSTDDNVTTFGALSNLTFANNVIESSYDAGLEGVGSWTNCTFDGNVFINNFRCAIGGWYGTNWMGTTHTYSGGWFYIQGCTFQNNITWGAPIEFTSVGGSSGPAGTYDDATGNSLWGWDGNTFSGDSFAIPTPPAPTNLTATPGNGQITLSWSPVYFATNYAVFRSTSSGTETFLGWVNGGSTNFTDTNVSNGTTYFYEITAHNTAADSGFSNEASATPGATATAPSITTQPTSQTVTAGQSATFSVTASGTAPLSYQWQKLENGNWVNISGATFASFAIDSAQASDAGQYEVVVSNSAGSVTSNSVSLTVNPVVAAPSITSQPADQTVNVGDSATFSVTASGTDPLSYQWQKLVNGTWVNISGATSPTFTIYSAQASDGGQYWVVVSNSAGSVTSNSVSLTVNAVVSNTLQDAGFESPSVGTGSYSDFQYDPAGTPWTFSGNAGVAGNGSGFTSGNPDAPEGTQVGFLQQTGSFSQTLSLAAGSYQISFQAAQRANWGGTQSFQVLVDGQVVGTFSNLSTAYTGFTTNAFTVTAGNHSITFQGLDPDGGDDTAFIDQVSLNAASNSLPAPWVDGDIGSPGMAGSASYASGTFTVSGGGGDIWNTSDQFHFVYQSLSGDDTIIAHVGSEQDTSNWAKAGVMIRDGTGADASYVYMFVTPNNGAGWEGANLEYRDGAGSSSVGVSYNAGITAPEWVKLVRSGNTFTGYYSADGVNWASAGSITVAMASTVDVGLAVTAHDNSQLNTATFDNVSVNAASNVLFSDNFNSGTASPAWSLAPASGWSVSNGQLVQSGPTAGNWAFQSASVTLPAGAMTWQADMAAGTGANSGIDIVSANGQDVLYFFTDGSGHLLYSRVVGGVYQGWTVLGSIDATATHTYQIRQDAGGTFSLLLDGAVQASGITVGPAADWAGGIGQGQLFTQANQPGLMLGTRFDNVLATG
jgi:hypothetical protein